MRKVKLFKSIESELDQLENEINSWVVGSGAKIVSITGNIAPQSGSPPVGATFTASDVLVIVLYESDN